MKYFIAIIHTILLVLIPMVMLPLIQWYKKQFLEPTTDLGGIYLILLIISIIMVIMTIARWFSAIADEPIKNVFK